MPPLTIYLGYRNYSSWSMRGWLAVQAIDVPYEERVFDLSDPVERLQLHAYSPTGKVPVLHDGDLVISDSLAICEYLAEGYPEAGLWPADPAERACARAVAAEMHSSFTDLRTEMPMNIRRSSPGKGRSAAVQADVDRVTRIWRECPSTRRPGHTSLEHGVSRTSCLHRSSAVFGPTPWMWAKWNAATWNRSGRTPRSSSGPPLPRPNPRSIRITICDVDRRERQSSTVSRIPPASFCNRMREGSSPNPP